MKIELICFLYDNKMEALDLDIKLEDIYANVTMDTDDIETVRQVTKDGSNEIDSGRCIIHLKSGDAFEIGKSYEDMIALWNKK